MGFSWLDGFLVLVAIVVILWEIRRDLGQALFDTLSLVLGLRLALWLGPSLSRHLGMGDANHARAVALLLLFVAGAGVGLIAGFYLNTLTRWTLDQFDRVAGVLLGFSGAVIVCHVLVTAIVLFGTTKAGPPTQVVRSSLAQEALTFHTFRQVVKFFDGLRV